MIRFKAVSKRYPGGHDALRGLDFHVERGELVFLTGHSGAGKSTLLKLIPVLERPSGGSINVHGVDLSRLGKRRIPFLRRRIGMIFQDHRLLLDRTIYDNVALPLIINGVAQRDIPRRVRAALDKVGLLNREKAYPVTLSGGEQQRVGIARAVVTRPPILLADEPTGNLDPELSADIMTLFEQFNRVGVTILIASHDLGLIQRMRHRCLVLERGALIDDLRPGGAA
ncbi:cell division transport system ATP-binding protein [Natronocella acetinitrilica]|jgi:cell division transport system ATP-binding protein|uniref:Cell division ATP-binding protein FtsE n=1 Tax=Natronocella acetinitrilica TaxID=414046 RepID=A0AAE3G0K1_9GAMM|nr:cell division ATP-binding protein FtsE [Natronocella acetinitrilica]MCP1673127.1 cell division transport system ATP-binding protein [Natronocella acetinitrilica]